MAIIRNERSRRAPGRREEAQVEEEIDYSWHPNEEEFVSPLTAEQWAELLGDPSFAESDAARAVRCLLEYGGPATFQQLSIRYRGTMGRYRRWLSEAAQAAGERFGVPAPQKDQFGMDEWWPLLYCVRNTGKPGAGIQEMLLRPEVVDAYEVIAEQERQAKRAENARNLKRIEQLERARAEEREREAARLAAEREAAEREATEGEAAEKEAVRLATERAMVDQEAAELAGQDLVQDIADKVEKPEENQPIFNETDTTEVVSVAANNDDEAAQDDGLGDKPSDPVEENPVASDLSALQDFLERAAAQRGKTDAQATKGSSLPAFDVAAPIDYALRYAERLRAAIALMQEGAPRLCAAQVARALGDESVEELQGILNGQRIPSFSYLDRVANRLFANVERLEVRDGLEDEFPVFCTLEELLEPQGAARAVASEALRGITYVVCKKRSHQSCAVLHFGDLRCALLSRVPFSMKDDLAAVEELDAFARELGIERTTREVSADVWDVLLAGRTWPGTIR